MTKVKICGLQHRIHVEASIEAKADYIGFVFAESSRRVTKEQARLLAKGIPSHIKKVGVFVNEDIATIKEIAEYVPLDVIQLHGKETKETIDALKSYEIIKAISIQTKEDLQRIQLYPSVDYFLFDAPGVEYEGGSGKTFDWSLLEEAGITKERVFIAGGLNEANVQLAVKSLKPFAVDVSSGVETKRIKDPLKIKGFINKAKTGVNV